MQVIKVVGASAGLLLLTILVPVALGVLGRSPVGLLVLLVVVLVVGAVAWGRRMDASAGKSWFVRQFDQGATQAHDRVLEDNDAMRERNAAHLQQRSHDLE